MHLSSSERERKASQTRNLNIISAKEVQIQIKNIFLRISDSMRRKREKEVRKNSLVDILLQTLVCDGFVSTSDEAFETSFKRLTSVTSVILLFHEVNE